MLNVKSFAIAGGILCAIVMFIVTLISLINGYAGEFLNIMTNVYPGYKVSGIGVITGAIYGFIDGFIGCYVFAWIYNRAQK